MSELVNEHKRTYDDDTMRNLTDVYLKQIKESNDPNFNGIVIFIHMCFRIQYKAKKIM